MEKWTDSSFMKFMRAKGKVMHMGRNNPMCQHKLESSLAEEVSWWTLNWPWASNNKEPNDKGGSSNVGCIAKSVAKRLKEVILSSALVRRHSEGWVQCWAPQSKRDTDLLGWVQNGSTKMINGLSYEERLRLFSLEKRRLRGDLINTAYHTWWEWETMRNSGQNAMGTN